MRRKHQFRLLLGLVLLSIPIFIIAQNKTYPSAFYLVGEGYAEVTGSPEDVMAAKSRAMGDLTSQIQANVKSEFVNEVTETTNSLNEYAASKVKVISEMQIDGVRWEMEEHKDYILARAIINKDETSELYFEKTRQLIDELQQKMGHVSNLMQSGQNEQALRQLFESAKVFNEIEQNVMIYMILGGRQLDALSPSISRSDLDDRIFKLTQTEFRNFDDAINGLCFQISEQVESGEKITVFPFEFEDTSFGSALSEYIRQQINVNLAKFIQFKQGDPAGAEGTSEQGVMVTGTYWLRNDQMELLVTLYNEGKTIGSARVNFPLSFAEATGVAYKPQNFVEAKSEDKLFSKSEVVYGDLKVEFWTNKGNRNLIFTDGEEMRLYVRVNTPAYVRFIYHLANGMRTPLYNNYYIDQSKVNKTVELPDAFECAPPFGVEKLQIFVSTDQLPQLNQKQTTIDGATYDVLAEDLATFLGNTRGMIKKKQSKTAERVITITTVPKGKKI